MARPLEEDRAEAGIRGPRNLTAWHFKRAKECNLEADFVEGI